MRILFVVDGRSCIANAWIEHFVNRSDCHVCICSTFPFNHASNAGVTYRPLPSPFWFMYRLRANDAGERAINKGRLRDITGRYIRSHLGLMSWFHQRLKPLYVYAQVRSLSSAVQEFEPDLVHAMRIPMEGILASMARPPKRLLLSIWGNDLTLFARHRPLIRLQTRHALAATDALHADCQRDIELAGEYGFRSDKPRLVAPTAGGINPAVFCMGPKSPKTLAMLRIPPGAPIVINPRGWRGYIRNDVFFRAIPKIKKVFPNVVYLCPGMRHDLRADQWVSRLAIAADVRLLPPASREGMADLFRIADVSVSASTHDGTPNSLLEAMACGSFPVAGDIQSIREWITHGKNGLLFDSEDADDLADAVITALRDGQLRKSAGLWNQQVVNHRATYEQVMRDVEKFYEGILTLEKPSMMT